jgi:nucleoside 2-deoxyribosyltransferase
MGQVVEVAFDAFRPRVPAPNKDTEIKLAGDVFVLSQIEQWARAQRLASERQTKPLSPQKRVDALRALAAIKHQPY